MRSFFYTSEQISAARERCLPRLRQFAADCRRKNPIPAVDELSAKDRCRLKVYTAKMQAFTPYSPWSEECVGILHSDLVGLLAAQQVFQEHLNCLVLLTADERTHWYQAGDHVVYGWYWYLWWKIHVPIPRRFRVALAALFPAPKGFEYWIVTSGRGSTAFHEVWRYDGSEATLVDPSFAAVSDEHGPIDEWFE